MMFRLNNNKKVNANTELLEYKGFKIQLTMLHGFTIKYFKEFNGRFYKLKEQNFGFLKLENGIDLASQYIDENENKLNEKLEIEIKRKS